MRNLHGFSLLEMLIVLMLMGLLVSLVGARMHNSLGGATRQFELDVIAQWLKGVGNQSRVLQRERVLINVVGGSEDAPPEIPFGWELNFDPPLLVSAYGTCSESIVTARYYSSEMQIQTRFRVLALSCRIDKGDAS